MNHVILISMYLNLSVFYLTEGHFSHVLVSDAEQGNHGDDSTGLTPDCSPPSPDTALRNIERVIRPQVHTHAHTGTHMHTQSIMLFCSQG